MASNHTTNFNLSQWEENDEVLRADFNADNLKLDAALSAVGQQLQSAQSQTAAAIQAAEQQIQTVQTQTTAAVQAAESKTAEEATRAKAAEAALTAKCGNCVVVAGTYTGNASSSIKSRTLSFSYKPVLVFLNGLHTMVRDLTSSRAEESGYAYNLNISWASRSVTWSSGSSSGDYSNTSGMTYYYVALLDKEG